MSTITNQMKVWQLKTTMCMISFLFYISLPIFMFTNLLCYSDSLRRSARLQQHAESDCNASPEPCNRDASPLPCNSHQHEDVVRYVCHMQTSIYKFTSMGNFYTVFHNFLFLFYTIMCGHKVSSDIMHTILCEQFSYVESYK